MTPLQTKLYWREWAATWRALTALRPDLTYRDADRERHDLHRRALGYPRSSTDLDNPDFDKILATFRSFSRPDDLSAQRRQINQPRARMLWKIEHDFIPKLDRLTGSQGNAYLLAILLDRFNTDDISTLTDGSLRQLIVTLAKRIERLEAEAQAESEPEPAECPF